MAISREKKEEVVRDVDGILKDSESVVFVGFRGLSVGDTTALRRDLREKGIGYRVAKKTLVKRSLEAAHVKGDQPELEGELALAYGNDPVAPAREIHTFRKGHQDNVAILGGIYEGAYMDAASMTELAQIPGLDALRGMFANIINSPIQRFAIALDQVAQTKTA